MTTQVDGLIVLSYQLDAWKDLIDVTLDRCRQLNGPDRWAIREKGCCLDKDGDWILEPIPSSRDDDFYAMCRFPSAQAALEFWKGHKCKSRFEHYRERAKYANV